MSANVYYSPEKFGLTLVGQVEWSDGNYQFDTTLVLKSEKTGELFYVEDSGCSCPTPFEGHDLTTLTKVTRRQELIDHFNDRRGHIVEVTYGGYALLPDIDAEIGHILGELT